MRWRLLETFILRPMLQDRARTLTTVFGVALGVAVVIAIQLTNQSSVRGFEAALDTVAGNAAVEIIAPGGIDETLLPDLGWLREYGQASLEVDVAPGQVVPVFYALPWHQFTRGAIGLEKQRRPGVGALVGILGGLLALVGLVVALTAVA